jgi:hypothetical protein
MDISPDKTREIFTLLAIELAQEAGNRGEPISLLHPHIKQAWEYLYWIYYLNSLPRPEKVTDFIRYLYTPVEEWKIIGQHFQEMGITGRVLDENGITLSFRVLAEKVENTYNPKPELEDAYFRALYDICKNHKLDADYTELRFFLNQSPTYNDLYSLEETPWSSELTPPLLKCYEPIPNSCILGATRNPYIVICPHCRWALNWNKLGEASCHAGGVCDELYNLSDYRDSEDHRRPYEDGMQRTKGGVQRYVVAPEVSLLAIYRNLSQEWNLHLELFPQLDSYDLSILLPSGEHWAVDVKDWKSAVSLAIGLNEHRFRYQPQWDKAFYVFPDYRANRAYMNEFRTYWTRQNGVELLSQSQFLKRIKGEIQ